ALEAVKFVNPKLVVPVHYNTWPLIEQDAAAWGARVEEATDAKVKVIFENDFLTEGGAGLSSDDFKRKLCEISERAGVDWVKTSSGYGFVKQADGSYTYKGATEHDLKLMRESCSDHVQVKAAGGVRDLDGLIKVRDLGATRCGATATAKMLDDYLERAKSGDNESSSSSTIGKGGY
ncbi:MAG: deoxyribose-phosphate aldolase, partial [Planctomycetota bacterium]